MDWYAQRLWNASCYHRAFAMSGCFRKIHLWISYAAVFCAVLILVSWDKMQAGGFAALCPSKAYIVPYFVLCLCNLIATLGMEFLAEIRGRELFASAIRHLFYILYSFGDASKMPNCSPLWFLPCLFICDIYLYFFVRLSKAKKVLCFWQVWLSLRAWQRWISHSSRGTLILPL